jgi:hypothetical protein
LLSYADWVVDVEVRDVCEGDLLIEGRCMLDLAEEVSEEDVR